jgi:hypothetical protein
MRRLCPIVLPVDGLLAHAASTLREAEYALLATLAGAPREAADELLLTVDRFVRRPTTIGLIELEREHLLDRLGLFGVRLATELIRTGAVRNAGELAAEMSRRSGLDRLRSVLLTQFEQRSRILKARSALAVLGDVLRTDGGPQAAELRAAAEELTAGTHEFEEVRLLDSVRSGAVELAPAKLAELDQLLGGSGHDPASRLGLAPEESSPDQIRTAALAALTRWQRVAEHPLSSRPAQLAARTATRTLEGVLAALS